MSIDIFSVKGKTAKPKKRLSKKAKAKLNAEKARCNLDKLHPMSISLLSVKLEENPNNEFIRSTADAVINKPHVLTDKWIVSINKWVDSFIKGALLDEPDLEEGYRGEFGPIRIDKIAKPKIDVEFPMPAIICVDDRGWKWYFKTSKAYQFEENDVIMFTATISAHKEGISFLRRPSKIRKAESINLNTGVFND